jgi:hypothetical protein
MEPVYPDIFTDDSDLAGGAGRNWANKVKVPDSRKIIKSERISMDIYNGKIPK